MCGSCYNSFVVNRTPENREKYLARNRAKYRPASPEERRRSHLQTRYGLTPQGYDQMLEDQNGACAICLRVWVKGRLYVDHNHTTGAVRALLCPSCNTLVGVLEKTPGIVANALALLQRELDGEQG
jgi:hypothetical protein